MPTHINIKQEEDQNILTWSNKICFLKEFYNVIVRPHPKSLSRNESTIKNLKKYKYTIDNNYNRNISKLIQCSDIVIVDYGAIIFEGLYLNKNIILLDMINNSKYVKELTNNNSLEIKIRNDLIFLQQNVNRNEILNKIKSSLSHEYQKQIEEKKLEIFGLNKGLSYAEVIDFLKKL